MRRARSTRSSRRSIRSHQSGDAAAKASAPSHAPTRLPAIAAIVPGAPRQRAAAPEGCNGRAGPGPRLTCSPGSTSSASVAHPCAGCAPGGARSTRSPGVDAIAAPLGGDPVVGKSVGCVGGTWGRSGTSGRPPRAARAPRVGRVDGNIRSPRDFDHPNARCVPMTSAVQRDGVGGWGQI